MSFWKIIHLCFPSDCGSSAIMDANHCTQLFMWILRICTQVTRFVWQAFLSTESSLYPQPVSSFQNEKERQVFKEEHRKVPVNRLLQHRGKLVGKLVIHFKSHSWSPPTTLWNRHSFCFIHVKRRIRECKNIHQLKVYREGKLEPSHMADPNSLALAFMLALSDIVPWGLWGKCCTTELCFQSSFSILFWGSNEIIEAGLELVILLSLLPK